MFHIFLPGQDGGVNLAKEQERQNVCFMCICTYETNYLHYVVNGGVGGGGAVGSPSDVNVKV